MIKLNKLDLLTLFFLISVAASFIILTPNLTGKTINIGTTVTIGADNVAPTPKEAEQPAGVFSRPRMSYYVDPNPLELTLNPGDKRTEIIPIINKGTRSIHIDSVIYSLQKFITPKNTPFDMSPGITKEILLDINIDESTRIGVYLGQIVISIEDQIELKDIIINVNPLNPVFELKTILTNHQIQPNQDLKLDLRITNIGTQEPTEITILYDLKDFEGNSYSLDQETITITDMINLDKELIIPKQINLGNYVLITRLIYKDQIIVDSQQVEIFEPHIERPLMELNKTQKIFISVFLTLSIALLILYFLKVVRKMK